MLFLESKQIPGRFDGDVNKKCRLPSCLARCLGSLGFYASVSYKLSLWSSYLLLFQVVRTETGNCTETMSRRSWDVQDLIGQHAGVRLIDDSSEGWGHINFDDLKGDIICDTSLNG